MKKVTKFFQTKATSIDEDSKTVTFAISNDSVDRMGEVVDQKSWDFKDYQNNPQFLWGHDPSEPENVLGQCLDLQVSKDGSETLGTFQFDTDINPKADLVFKQVKRGSLRTVSVGFISDKVEYVKEIPHLVGNKLLEVSVVPIPANATALAKDFQAGVINRKDLKWLKESAESELDFINKELEKQTNDEDGLSMEVQEQLKQFAQQNSALLEAITTLTKSQAATDKLVKEFIEKGAVSDILAAGDPWLLEDAKWEKMAPVGCIYYALCEAYSYTGTPVDDFDVLLKEFIGLVSQVLDGSYNGKADGRLADAVARMDEPRVKAIFAQHTKDGAATTAKGADAPAPAQPEQPEQPEVPAEPATPADPAPAQPEAPAAPVTEPEAPAADPAPEAPAEEPAAPAAPATPEAPTTPDEPAKGDEATQPDNSANGGDNDQPGAEDGKELDLDAELTPELQEQIDKALATAED